MLSTPEFFVAYIMMALFAVKFEIFPSLALVDDDAPLGEKLHASVLPVMTLAFVTIPPVMRIIRAALISSLNSDYVEMAVLKGISPLRIMSYHVLPNNIGAICNALALGMANLIAGIIIVEVVFVYPGMGSLLLGSIYYQDVPLILVCGTILASIYIVLLMLADLVAIASNPKLISKTRMNLLHPGHVIAVIKYTPLAIVIGLVIYLVQILPKYEPEGEIEFVMDSTMPDPATARSFATVDELFNRDFQGVGAVHNARFMPRGTAGPAHAGFQGTIAVDPLRLLGRRAGGQPRYGFGEFPAVDIKFVTAGNQLVPLSVNFLPLTDKVGQTDSNWALLVGPGKTWAEAGDGSYSRASFPFTLVGRRGGDSHAGIAMFVYDNDSVSNLRFQITQETSLNQKFTSWGQLNITYSSAIPQDSDAVVKAFHRYQESRMPRQPWDSLFEQIDRELLGFFNGDRGQGNVTSSGMIIDGVIYQQPCKTRFGDFPYCEEMRHGVFSITKSMGAAVSMARLVQKFGKQVLDQRTLDYVDIHASHDGWDNVTFEHALNMATGIGDIFPERVDFYVDGDESEAAYRVFRAETTEDKIREVGRYRNYPWSPGEVLRYRSTDTFILSVAMDRFLKTREGPDAMLWEMMNREVYQQIGIRYLPSMHTEDPDPLNQVPDLGYQLFPTVDDIARIVALLRNGGKHNEAQLLDHDLVTRMLNPGANSGLPSGWYYREGGEARYALGYWLIPHRGIDGCEVTIPAMVGAGGNNVIPMDNGITAFRFADRYEDNPGTYDSYHMRKISDRIKSVCR